MTRGFTVIESGDDEQGSPSLRSIIATFDPWLIRLYCRLRFQVIPLRFLQDMGQYVPRKGRVLDLGCGFGLFTLYFATCRPDTEFVGVDLCERRIALARKSAERLGLTNVTFVAGDARRFAQDAATGDSFSGAFTLDLLHHMTPSDGDALIALLHDALLDDEAIFILKDVTTRPRYMLWFTYLLDRLMNPRDDFHYRSLETWGRTLRSAGFTDVEHHHLWDLMPYPHVLLVARKS